MFRMIVWFVTYYDYYEKEVREPIDVHVHILQLISIPDCFNTIVLYI